mmetsp:Transcript_10440/g.30762  ORF Transcript_10440/g.30762 Transcript_10440/m.30762 type:complete len:250 (-) Transcript_10440:2384-3133(-)
MLSPSKSTPACGSGGSSPGSSRSSPGAASAASCTRVHRSAQASTWRSRLVTGFAAPQRWQRAERAPVFRAADDDVVDTTSSSSSSTGSAPTVVLAVFAMSASFDRASFQNREARAFWSAVSGFFSIKGTTRHCNKARSRPPTVNRRSPLHLTEVMDEACAAASTPGAPRTTAGLLSNLNIPASLPEASTPRAAWHDATINEEDHAATQWRPKTVVGLSQSNSAARRALIVFLWLTSNHRSSFAAVAHLM